MFGNSVDRIGLVEINLIMGQVWISFDYSSFVTCEVLKLLIIWAEVQIILVVFPRLIWAEKQNKRKIENRKRKRKEKRK